MKMQNLVSLFTFAIAWSVGITAHAGQGLRIRCGQTRLPSVSLLIFDYDAHKTEFRNTQLLTDEGDHKDVRVEATQGSEYRIEIPSLEASPSAPRTIYSFSTGDAGATLQIYRKSGTDPERAVGPKLNCSRREFEYAD